MEKPVDRLDAMEKRFQAGIKRIAIRFNEINKEIREFQAWLLSAKKSIQNVNKNYPEGRKSLTDLRAIIENKIRETIKRCSILEKNFRAIEEEIGNIAESIRRIGIGQMEDRTLSRIAIDFFAEWTTIFVKMKEDIENKVIPNIAILATTFQVMGQSSLSQSDYQSRDEAINKIFKYIGC